jgi:proline dehydrogenase
MKYVNRIFASSMQFLPKWFVKPFAKPYVAGLKTDEVLNVVKKLNSEGFSATIDILGEFVNTQSEALDVKNQYAELIRLINKKKLDSTVSVKLTHMGLELDFDYCKKLMIDLTEKAKKFNVGITIDMENSPYTDNIYEIYKDSLKTFDKVGAVMQAYLHRSINDLKALNNSKLFLRVCKGIYNEDSKIAIKDSKEINKNFKLLTKTILKGSGYACIATHDINLINSIEKWICDNNISKDRFEFQVLYGVPMAKTLDNLKSKGYKVTVYVPFGNSWYDYSMRRLKENPKIISYVIKNIFKK